MKRRAKRLRWARWLVSLGLCVSPAVAGASSEYILKAAILYNFTLFTEWPSTVRGDTLNVCVYGRDPFDKTIDALTGKAVGERHIAVQRRDAGDSLADCHVLFISPAAIQNLPSVLQQLNEAPVLTVADSPGATKQGVILNMVVVKDKVQFEANLHAARAARLTISSKLLRLATDVIQ